MRELNGDIRVLFSQVVITTKNPLSLMKEEKIFLQRRANLRQKREGSSSEGFSKSFLLFFVVSGDTDGELAGREAASDVLMNPPPDPLRCLTRAVKFTRY